MGAWTSGRGKGAGGGSGVPVSLGGGGTQLRLQGGDEGRVGSVDGDVLDGLEPGDLEGQGLDITRR